MSEWQPIETAPRDGEMIITGVDIADEWIVRAAFWSDDDTRSPDEMKQYPPEPGWWSYENSVSQELLEGMYAPTHWIEMPEIPKRY